MKGVSAYFSAVASGFLLWAAFFPLNLGPLAFVALVPWLMLVRAEVSNRHRYLAAYLGGVVFFLLALQWIRVAHPMMYFSWIGLAIYCPLYWIFALFLIRRLDRRRAIPLAVTVPVVWVALEYVRAHFPTGFPFLQPLGLHQMVGFGWYFLGYTQHDFLPLIQIADLAGVYGVSFLVGMTNGFAAEWLMTRPCNGRVLIPCVMTSISGRRLVVSGAVTLTAFTATLLYGWLRLQHEPFVSGPQVAALQGSVPQMDKIQARLAGPEDTPSNVLTRTYVGLYRKALDAQPKYDLIIWPETCCIIDWYEPLTADEERTAPASYLAGYALAQNELVGSEPPTNVLFGLNGFTWENGRIGKYNSAVLLGPRGTYLGRYDKIHLVPFGEYVPFRETLPWMRLFTPYQHDYSCRPGERWTRFPLNSHAGSFTFGCLICYEDSDPYLARQYVRQLPVDFLVNISNDGWFDGTEEHEQHLAICRLRAVEARRAVVRAVNMGISSVIDADGRVVALPGPTNNWSDSKKIEAILSAKVPIDCRRSLYAISGDWLPASCWLIITIGIIVSLWFSQRIE